MDSIPPVQNPTELLQEQHFVSSRDRLVITLCVVLGILSTAVTCTRLWTQRVLLKRFGAEDALIAVAMVMSWGMLAGCVVAAMTFGFDKHAYQLTIPQRVKATHFVMFGEFGYVIIGYVIKMAILLFYLRLTLKTTHRASRIFNCCVYATAAAITLHRVAYITVVLTSCKPFNARWLRVDPAWASQHKFTCRDEGNNLFVASILSSVEDLVIAVMPTPIFWNLHIPRRRKIAIWSLFATSICTGIISAVRTYVFYVGYFDEKYDWFSTIYWAWLLTAIETIIGLMCASAPFLPPFFSHHLSRDRKSAISAFLGRIHHLFGYGLHDMWHGRSHNSEAPDSLPQNAADTGIFDGTSSTVSKAQITWTSTATVADQGHTTAGSFMLRSRTYAEDEESDFLNSGSFHFDDAMAIYVRSSFCVVEEHDDGYLNATPNDAGG